MLTPTSILTLTLVALLYYSRAACRSVVVWAVDRYFDITSPWTHCSRSRRPSAGYSFNVNLCISSWTEPNVGYANELGHYSHTGAGARFRALLQVTFSWTQRCVTRPGTKLRRCVSDARLPGSRCRATSGWRTDRTSSICRSPPPDGSPPRQRRGAPGACVRLSHYNCTPVHADPIPAALARLAAAGHCPQMLLKNRVSYGA